MFKIALKQSMRKNTLSARPVILLLWLVLLWPSHPIFGVSPQEQSATATLNPTPTVLTLRDAQRLALAQNPTLKAAKARIEQARARVQQALSLYFPNVSLTARATHTELADATVDAARRSVTEQLTQGLTQAALSTLTQPEINLTALGLRTAPSLLGGLRALNAIPTEKNTYTVSLVANYLVFDGFSRRFSYLAATFGQKELTEADKEVTRILLAGVARAYHGLQLAQEELRIAQADKDFNQRLLYEAQARKEAGVGSLSDVLNFEVRVRAAEAQWLSAQRNVENARATLAALMGLGDAALPQDMSVPPLEEETEKDFQVPEFEEVWAKAQARPDLTLGAYTVERQKALEKAKKGAFFPQVGVFASYDAQRGNNADFSSDDFTGTVGLNVSYSVFAGGRNKAALAEARAARKESEFTLAEKQINASQEVRTALIELRTAVEQVKLQRESAVYVARNRDLVEKEYKAGQTSLARLNQAQRDLVEAEGRLAQARVSLRQAWENLYSATGEILEKVTQDSANDPDSPTSP